MLIFDLENIFKSNEFISKKRARAYYNAYLNHNLILEEVSSDHLSSFNQFEKYITQVNDRYITKELEIQKLLLDNLLYDLDPKISLDENQRQVILRDEDYTLVLAGAGAGKTTTIAAKVKYLVDYKKIDPSRILIVSYTNDAVNELKERINQKLKIPAIITTFHKTGYAIVKKARDLEKTRVIHEGLMFNVIKDYLLKNLIEQPEELRRLVLFFGFYIDDNVNDAPLESYILKSKRTDYSTLKSNIDLINEEIITEKKKKKVSINEEILRSIDEVIIANFLYIHNIDYEYEAAYPFTIEGSDKIYTPDFTIKHNGKTIYLEHFGIREDGTHSRYNDEELDRYKNMINEKILLHRQRKTELIYTFSEYSDQKPMLMHLKEALEKLGIPMIERSSLEIYQQLTKESSNKYINRFILLVLDFIQSFKTNGYKDSDFTRLYNKTNNVRSRMFINLVKPIYYYYQTFLENNNMLDFSDMINESVTIVDSMKKNNVIPDFDYIIVDEYQDISKQRFDLTSSLCQLTNAKIIAVGDDWQSIFAFAGSRIDLFLKFKKVMGYADYLNINFTYRNAQEVIDIAGGFIQKNSSQIKKTLKSSKTIKNPIEVFEYSDLTYKNEIKGFKGILHEKAKICALIIEKIYKENPTHQIALLVRYNFEISKLGETDFFTLKEYKGRYHLSLNSNKKAQLIPMTIHASKGLGFDEVIILNGSDEVFGFPAQIEMDPLLKLVKYDDTSYSYAEERRLFYVALTRTKNRVYLLYPKSKPSTFIKELAKEHELVVIHGDIEENVPLHDRHEKNCPLCKYPLQFKKSKAYNGLKLFMCTNDPELCDYMSNNLRSGIESISKCPSCIDGYLIVKASRKEERFFFGCTNYANDGKGCNHTKEII